MTGALLIALGFEALGVFALAQGLLVAAFALHVACAGLCALGSGRGRKQRGADARTVDTWFLAALLPLTGVVTLLLVDDYLGRPGRMRPGESWEDQRRRAAKRAEEEKEREQQVTPDLLPLVDALRDDDVNVRISAIDALRHARSNRAVALLGKQRDNDNYEVRFRAAEALGKISAQSLEEISAAKRALQIDDSAAAHRRLAELSFRYADLGLDSAEVNRAYLERAVAHCQLALERHADDPEVQLLLGKSYFGLDALDLAEAAYGRVASARPAEALLGLAEVEFARRDFRALKLTCHRLAQRGVRGERGVRDAVAEWCGEDTVLESRR